MSNLELVGPCRDGNCCSTRDHSGMRTNGGCHCRTYILKSAPEIVDLLKTLEKAIENKWSSNDYEVVEMAFQFLLEAIPKEGRK